MAILAGFTDEEMDRRVVDVHKDHNGQDRHLQQVTDDSPAQQVFRKRQVAEQLSVNVSKVNLKIVINFTQDK